MDLLNGVPVHDQPIITYQDIDFYLKCFFCGAFIYAGQTNDTLLLLSEED